MNNNGLLHFIYTKLSLANLREWNLRKNEEKRKNGAERQLEKE